MCVYVCVRASGCTPAIVYMYVYLCICVGEKHLQAVSENSPFRGICALKAKRGGGMESVSWILGPQGLALVAGGRRREELGWKKNQKEKLSLRETEKTESERKREAAGEYRPAQRLPAALSRPLSSRGICALLAGVLILKAVITLPVLWRVSPPHS